MSRWNKANYALNTEEVKGKVTAWQKANPHRLRGYRRKRKFGLIPSDIEALLNSQCFRCSICQLVLNEETARVDHCHTTNKVRGLLCRRCNVGLGNYDDNPDRLRRAAEYLENNLRS